jgi:uncharacterized protein
MKFTLKENTTNYQIQRIDSSSVTVGNKTYSQNIIITPNQIITWDVINFKDLKVSHFEQLRDLQPELALLGTGDKSRFPIPKLLVPLMEAKIGLEVMNTAAACRTYTLLTTDDRNVAVALLF